MKSVQFYVEMYRSAAQAAIPQEPVHAVGVLSRPGALRAAAVGMASPLAATIMRRGQKKRAGGFPPNVLMAVTPSRLVVFAFRPRGSSSVKITGTVAEWPWSAVRVAAGEGENGRQLFFHLVDDTTLELEAARGLGKYTQINDPFYASIGLGARS